MDTCEVCGSGCDPCDCPDDPRRVNALDAMAAIVGEAGATILRGMIEADCRLTVTVETWNGEPLGPGERIVNGRRLYSAAWL